MYSVLISGKEFTSDLFRLEENPCLSISHPEQILELFVEFLKIAMPRLCFRPIKQVLVEVRARIGGGWNKVPMFLKAPQIS